MKRVDLLSKCLLLIALTVGASITVSAQTNTISGVVFDATGRQPISNIYVELQNEVYSNLGRVRTDGSGRFMFTGISSGTFRVRVIPIGTNYLEETQEATIHNFTRGGRSSSDRVFLEFNLRLDKRKVKSGSPGAASTIFVQANLPENAREAYEKGAELLDDKKDAGLDNLKKAIEIFPTYYDALNRLGVEYAKRGKYVEAAPFLIKAIEVNQRSFESFYWLGIASHNLKHPKEAMEALRAATILNPQSINAQLWYGIVLRLDGSYELSEKALQQAKTLAKETPVSEIHWQLGLLYNNMKRYQDAANELEAFLKLQPNSRDAEKIKNLIGQLRSKGK
ncbi:MAG: tetratricopeptide repeat protein [Acidobacteriota bacterium]|nr:tetratricopeptide repeat protein [Acidobacteriota bacterium]